MRGDRTFADHFEQSVDDGLASLAEELTPRITDQQARRLLAVLTRAQVEPPARMKDFVDQVNRLLDVYRLRIGAGTQTLYRLKFQPSRREGLGFIYLLDEKGIAFPIFNTTSLRLIDASARYESNKFHARGRSDLPVLALEP
jgi:hypothetical protein